MRNGTNVIYAFFDADDNPFYVGRTNNFSRRFRQHRIQLRRGNCLPKYNKLRKLLSTGADLEKLVRVIESGVPYRWVRRREQYWVKEFMRLGYRLSNLTEGGYGGFRWSARYRQEYGQRKRALRFHHSPQTREKISSAKRGCQFSSEHRYHLSIARRRRVVTQETREKMRVAMRGRRNTKLYQVASPDHRIFVTVNGLAEFCREHGLSRPNMVKVANGERRFHKGWRCSRVGYHCYLV